MTPRSTPAHAAAPTPSTGFAVVIGPCAVLAHYWPQPWGSVVRAAEAGTDGLRLDTFGSPTARPAAGEFVLREMTVSPISVTHGYPSLMEQRW